jgi:acetylornithine/LysW-gamma-L-lysine aminotransferase
MSNIIELHKLYEFDVYPKRDLVITKGKNAVLWDEDGNEYIDCVAGIGVASIGHSNDKVVEALSAQAATLITCPAIFYNDTKAKLLKKLIEITPPGLTKAFLCNSGTEAMEAALKFTRFVTKRTNFISAMKGFHGRTMGALSATFKKEYREDFNPLVPGFSFVPFGNFEKLLEAVDENTAGIILEPVQGEGGINIGVKEYFQSVRKLCDEKNIILIIDEIQSGFCRTGKMFAVEHFEIEPDILTVAKAFGGGMPIGAAVCSNKIEVPVGKHGTTFGGNPLACAAADAAIQFMLDNNLAQQAHDKGDYFRSKLDKIENENIRAIRNLGLMFGIELKSKVQPYLVELMKNGVLALPAGTTVIRLLPPLTIEYDQLDRVADVLAEVLANREIAEVE